MTTTAFKAGDLVKHNLIDGSATEVFRVIWVHDDLVHVHRISKNSELDMNSQSFSWRADYFTLVS